MDTSIPKWKIRCDCELCITLETPNGKVIHKQTAKKHDKRKRLSLNEGIRIVEEHDVEIHVQQEHVGAMLDESNEDMLNEPTQVHVEEGIQSIIEE